MADMKVIDRQYFHFEFENTPENLFKYLRMFQSFHVMCMSAKDTMFCGHFGGLDVFHDESFKSTHSMNGIEYSRREAFYWGEVYKDIADELEQDLLALIDGREDKGNPSEDSTR